MNGCMNQSKYPVGKDTVELIGDGKFQIGKYPDHLKLEMFNSEYDMVILDGHVKKYKNKKNTFYVIGDSYTVVNGETNTCKIYSISNKDTTSETKNGSVIIYIGSYDEFTDDEKRVFESMKK